MTVTTIRDVAARAGVSTATVSRYLRGQRVRAGDAVREAVDALGYTPNVVAQSLKSGRTGVIGVVVPDITNPFFAAVLEGCQQACRDTSYRMLLASSDESSQREWSLLTDLVRRVDAVLLAPTTEQESAPIELQRAGVPVVFIDRELAGGELFDGVLVDNRGGARAAARHLAELGHTRIAAIHGATDTTPGHGRRDGFLAGLAEHGLDLVPAYDRIGDFREESGRQLTLELLSLPEPPTAIFTANNLMTVGALKALRDMRVSVPDDMSLIGFDDLTLGSLLSPPLTCVARPDVEQGALAMRLLLSRLRDGGRDAPRRIVLDTRLTVRGSTAPPRRPHARRRT